MCGGKGGMLVIFILGVKRKGILLFYILLYV